MRGALKKTSRSRINRGRLAEAHRRRKGGDKPAPIKGASEQKNALGLTTAGIAPSKGKRISSL
jgi:hypothetical protein